MSLCLGCVPVPEIPAYRQVKTLNKLSVLIDQAEKIYFDAYRLQGAQWVDEDPLWLTWTLRHFGMSCASETIQSSDAYGQTRLGARWERS